MNSRPVTKRQILLGPLSFIACLLAISSGMVNAQDYPKPLMVSPGEIIISKSFNSGKDVDPEIFNFRKEAHHEVAGGVLKVIPPVVAYEGKQVDTKWAKSSMSRAGLTGLPQEFVCQFRWKYIRPDDERAYNKRNVYIDLGHRCIRTSLSAKGTTLKLENHLVGKEAAESSILLLSKPGLKLAADKWYDITIEVKGNEVIFQIDGEVLYGQHALIAKERANTFNLDSGGIGYLLDEVIIRKAGDFQSDWPARRASFPADQQQKTGVN
jgi:hypothetical protein